MPPPPVSVHWCADPLNAEDGSVEKRPRLGTLESGTLTLAGRGQRLSCLMGSVVHAIPPTCPPNLGRRPPPGDPSSPAPASATPPVPFIFCQWVRLVPLPSHLPASCYTFLCSPSLLSLNLGICEVSISCGLSTPLLPLVAHHFSPGRLQ